MASETAELTAAVKALTALTLDVAAQSGYLAPDQLVAAFEAGEAAKAGGFKPPRVLTVGQIDTARRLVRERQEAEFQDMAENKRKVYEARMADFTGRFLTGLIVERTALGKEIEALDFRSGGNAPGLAEMRARYKEADDLTKLPSEEIAKMLETHRHEMRWGFRGVTSSMVSQVVRRMGSIPTIGDSPAAPGGEQAAAPARVEA